MRLKGCPRCKGDIINATCLQCGWEDPKEDPYRELNGYGIAWMTEVRRVDRKSTWKYPVDNYAEELVYD